MADPEASGKASSAFDRISLRHKVPLVAAALLLLVGAAISAAAYLEVRHTALLAARQHVIDLVELVGASQRTGPQVVTVARRIGAQPAIAAFVAAPTPEHDRLARTALLEPPNPNVIASQVIDSAGRVLIDTKPGLDWSATDFPAQTAEIGDSGTVGRIRLVADSLVYPVTAPVTGGHGATVVQWRRVATGADGNRRTQKAVGATILIGNADGSFWTDLTRVIQAPPSTVRRSKVPVDYTRDAQQGRVVAAFMPLPGTPWEFGAEIPMGAVLAPARQFLRQILVITIVCVIVGWLAAWGFARRLTSPLIDLTDAADAIAAGERTGDIRIARADELGRLALSFNSMTGQVRESHQRLEEKVAERTAELHRTLQQLRDAQDALIRREKLATLGQLAAGVGHELRNPLGVMSNAIYYLDFVLESASDDVHDYLRMLREQVTLSTKIVTDLLESARITPAHRAPTDLRGIVETQRARLPKAVGSEIEVDLDGDLPPVDADPIHIGQAIYNLLTNATQALGERTGHIRVTAESRDDDVVALHVTDDGPGMSQDVLNRIFEPLFTTKARGIGLGLSVSRALVQANGGDISVRSEPGRGATFTITMPMAVRIEA